MRRSAPINIIVHAPTNPDGQAELAKRVSQIHADAVNRRIKELKCPTYQKQALLEAVINTVKERCVEQS